MQCDISKRRFKELKAASQPKSTKKSTAPGKSPVKSNLVHEGRGSGHWALNIIVIALVGQKENKKINVPTIDWGYTI